VNHPAAKSDFAGEDTVKPGGREGEVSGQSVNAEPARAVAPAGSGYRVDDLVIDVRTRQVTRDGVDLGSPVFLLIYCWR
jgi:hypothetical protein